MKKRIELKPTKNANFLEVEVDYDLGGMNFFTGIPTERGYYLHVRIVLVEDNFCRMRAFTGICTLLKPVKRKSDKAYKEACELAKDKEEKLIKYVLQKNNLKIKKEE